MAITISGTDGIVGAGFTVDNSGVSVTAGVGTFGSIGAGTSVAAAGLHGTMPTIDGSALTSINAAQLVGVCTSGLTRTGGFGKYIQTKQLINTSTQLLQSQSYTDVTGFSTSITPNSASNFLIVSSTINAGSTGSGGYILQRKIGSGSYSNLGTIIGTDDGNRLECTINVGQTGDSLSLIHI